MKNAKSSAWFVCRLIVVALTHGFTASAGLIINPTFNDAQFALVGYSAVQITQILNAVDYAAGELQAKFDDHIRVNIDVTSVNVGLGERDTILLGVFDNNGVKASLNADKKTADDAREVANPAVSDPTGSNRFFVSRAQAKALDLISNDAANDGTFTFDKNRTYSFDPLNRGVAGKFNLVDIAEHEICEIMGCIYTLGTLNSAYMMNDLFRYTSSGVDSISQTDTGVYFSINNGLTHLVSFGSNPNGDVQDYAGVNASDPFNAFTGTGQARALTSVDFTNMEVIGYDLHQEVAAFPEPSTFICFGIGTA